ncbi:hypothetical protein CFOL_v3_11303 [Cephalotus follicularis]|uniref:Cation-transporting ATPase n=1 Tax=Cephalotus follicularis TaxID=3775 RepID=A0A1Q3BIT4_CEPFO|nr:hypothetical protein CFOL_v3_11303 [Cephalotus follicularis]
MEDQGDSGTILGQSLLLSNSDSKVMREKRKSDELGERDELDGRKRVKMRDLDSVIRSDEINTHNPISLKEKGTSPFQFGEEEMSQVTEVPVTLDFGAFQAEKSGRDKLSLWPESDRRSIDLNNEACNSSNLACDDSMVCAENSEKLSLLWMQDRVGDNNRVASRGIGLDLNVEDVSSSVNQDPFDSYRKHTNLKLRDVSECGSCTGPLEEKDSLRVWKEMKQNGFLSSSHGGIIAQSGILSSSHGGIPVPKQRGRKSKQDAIKKKLDLAKREQVDRFTKIAAPSGLLNDLNPGIINHVRNRKQVHSIIESLVRSERLENGHCGKKQASLKDFSNRKDQGNVNDSGIHRLSYVHEIGPANSIFCSKQTRGHSSSMNRYIPSVLGDKSGDGESSMVDRVSEDDTLELKLSSLTKESENAIALSNEESTNFTSDSSLSVKAANVASQWLELIHQDIKGRLLALRRSRKRVRAVITTELPFLISKEFSSNQPNEPSNTTAGMHQSRWSTLFDQMDKSLSEEEQQMESWLNKVKEMQLHCDQGLKHIHWNTVCASQHGTSENAPRSEKLECSEKELAVRAAAASIYSTCSFLLSKENVSCR